MHIAIAGGTGFIGSRLADYYMKRGDDVTIITRAIPQRPQAGVRYATWQQLASNPDAAGQIDAIVNLAGSSINQRWTSAGKALILQSRLDATERVAAWVDALARKPQAVVNASGISIYGSSETAVFDERSPAKTAGNFLAEVIAPWEAAADHIRGTRVVKLRVGLVLGKGGGVLPLMALPYRLFAGGRVGSGRQWISWIHIDDMVRLIAFCIDNESVSGPINGSAPKAVTNDQFGRAIGRTLRRPHWMPVPGFMLKLVLGELSMLLLEGQNAYPWAAIEHGFTFNYPELDVALRDLLS